VVKQAITPLNQLLDKTQSIAAGDMEIHIARSQREDAVGRLQNSFASMLQALNFHMGSVRYTTEQAELRNKQLVEATRLAQEGERQKTAFIQNVSHQIRTPLNILMGFAQIISDNSHSSFSDEEMQSITDTMDHNSKLLNRIVKMLFDSSETGLSVELNSHKHDKVSCLDVARETIGYINEHYPNMTVHFSYDLPDDFYIETNQLYLMRSLRELLYNAGKYSDGKGVKFQITRTDTMVRFIVEDTGKGISDADRDGIFTFFTKVDDLSEGLGLGLPLAKRHAQNLGGDILLDADYHDGCRFILELPLS
jgi:signal transduction histidine kinase